MPTGVACNQKSEVRGRSRRQETGVRRQSIFHLSLVIFHLSFAIDLPLVICPLSLVIGGHFQDV